MIKARMVVSMLSNNKKALNKALDDIVKEIKQTNKVKNEFFSEPKVAGRKGTIISGFVEFEVQLKNFNDLMAMIVDKAPTVLEILEPDSFHIETLDLQDSINDFITIMRQTHETVAVVNASNIILKRRLDELLQNNNKKVKKKKN